MTESHAISATAAEVRAALARIGMTQTALAERTSRSQHFWSNRLRGRVPFGVADLEAISRITGVPVIALIEGAS